MWSFRRALDTRGAAAGDEVGGAEGRYGKPTESHKGVNRATARYPQEVLDGRYSSLGLTVR